MSRRIAFLVVFEEYDDYPTPGLGPSYYTHVSTATTHTRIETKQCDCPLCQTLHSTARIDRTSCEDVVRPETAPEAKR
jgi:hypothetical protein